MKYPKIIYAMSRERFGVKEYKEKPKQPSGPSRSQRKCRELRGEINKLKEAYREAPQEEKKAIDELQQEKLKKLRLAKRAETMKKHRKKLSKNCSESAVPVFKTSHSSETKRRT